MTLLPIPRQQSFGTDTVAWTEPRVTVTATIPAQGYRLSISDRGVELVAADDAGVFYER